MNQKKSLELFAKYLDAMAPAVKRVRFIGLVAGFGIVTVGNHWRGSDVPFLAENASTVFWVGLTILLLVNFLLLFIDKQTVETLQALHAEEGKTEQLEAELEELDQYLRALVAWLTLSKLMSELIDQLLREDNLGPEEKERIFNAAVEFIAERKLRLFGIEDDYLNISIYMYDDEKQELECVACYRSRPSDAQGDHRTWRPGEGHVGKAFELQRELICGDATALDVAAWIAAPPGKESDLDLERYVSLAAVPIAINADEPLGVIIMTSDQPGRFVNQSDGEEADDLAPSQGRYAVDALQDIAAQLAQIMCIVKANH